MTYLTGLAFVVEQSKLITEGVEGCFVVFREWWFVCLFLAINHYKGAPLAVF